MFFSTIDIGKAHLIKKKMENITYLGYILRLEWNVPYVQCKRKLNGLHHITNPLK